MTMFELPIVYYLPPNGVRTFGVLDVPYSREIADKSSLLNDLGIGITMELVFGQVNVCLDDGDFDYKFKLFPNGPELIDGVVKLVTEFDVNDYHARRLDACYFTEVGEDDNND